MNRILSKAKAAFLGCHTSSSSGAARTLDGASADQQPNLRNLPPPTPLDVLRYRYHHGTNLGAVFVLEKWLFPSMFGPGTDTQGSELAAVTASVQEIGVEATRRKWEDHWAGAVSDSGFEWLAETAHCTSIRLPIGYFNLKTSFLTNTPFAPFADVYINAWTSIRTFVQRARARGIGVLLDLHALPGGANPDDHSGTDSGKAELWGDMQNLDLAWRCVEFVASEAKSMDGVIGLQLVNEAVWEAQGMYDWYDTVIQSVTAIDSSLPLYISDAWNLAAALRYAQAKNALKDEPANPIIVDTHLYWAFADADKEKSPQQIVTEVYGKLAELDVRAGKVADYGAAQVIVGEYSCVMTEESWAKRGSVDKEQLVKDFGRAQSKRYQEKAGGSYFWTYRMDWMPGGEWGFVAQTNNGAILAPASHKLPFEDVRRRVVRARSMRDALLAASVAHHASVQPRFERSSRFRQGWAAGFADADAFFETRAEGGLGKGCCKTGADRIGCLEVWTRKRMAEAGVVRGDDVWEWEVGFRDGVMRFEEAVGLSGS